MELQYEKNRVFLENAEGKLVAEITFPKEHEGVVNINHTFVDASLRGQGMAGKLMDAAVREIESQGLKAIATCTYAIAWLEQNPERRSILR